MYVPGALLVSYWPDVTKYLLGHIGTCIKCLSDIWCAWSVYEGRGESWWVQVVSNQDLHLPPPRTHQGLIPGHYSEHLHWCVRTFYSLLGPSLGFIEGHILGPNQHTLVVLQRLLYWRHRANLAILLLKLTYAGAVEGAMARASAYCVQTTTGAHGTARQCQLKTQIIKRFSLLIISISSLFKSKP